MAGKKVYNGIGDWNDCPFHTENGYVVINFTNLDGEKGRFPVLALYDLSHTHLEVDQSILRKRGYMGWLNDWKNIEVTLYFRIFADEIDPNKFCALAFSTRGGPHHSNDCTGTALYVQLSFLGTAHITKELGKSTYTTSDVHSDQVADPIGHWIGMKGIFYTKSNGNPYIELWLDKEPVNNLNNWELILSKEDSGGWYLEDNNGCGGAQDEKITWGGPGVIFKINHLHVVDMKWGSIREILPPEGWPLRYLLKARDFPFPVSVRALVHEHGLTAPISLRELTEREAELYPFP